MATERVPGTDAVYALDVPMFATTGVNSPYVVDAPEPAIVDTGPADGVDSILEGLTALDIPPESVSFVIPTHAHLDHAGGAGILAQRCPNATVVCHERAVDYLTDSELLNRLEASVERAIGMPQPYGEPTLIDRDRCQGVSGGERIDLGDRELETIDAPGHAPHQLCLLDSATGGLFAGDAAGMCFPETGVRPTTPPPNFDLEGWFGTLERLIEYEPATILYAHFGPGTPGEGVAALETYREVLVTFVEEVRVARAECGDDVGAILGALDARWQHWALGTDVAGVCRYLGDG